MYSLIFVTFAQSFYHSSFYPYTFPLIPASVSFLLFSICASFHPYLFFSSLPLTITLKLLQFLYIKPFCCGKKKVQKKERDRNGGQPVPQLIREPNNNNSPIICLRGKLGCFQLGVLHDNGNKIISFRQDCASRETTVICLVWLKSKR